MQYQRKLPNTLNTKMSLKLLSQRANNTEKLSIFEDLVILSLPVKHVN